MAQYFRPDPVLPCIFVLLLPLLSLTLGLHGRAPGLHCCCWPPLAFYLLQTLMIQGNSVATTGVAPGGTDSTARVLLGERLLPEHVPSCWCWTQVMDPHAPKFLWVSAGFGHNSLGLQPFGHASWISRLFKIIHRSVSSQSSCSRHQCQCWAC